MKLLRTLLFVCLIPQASLAVAQYNGELDRAMERIHDEVEHQKRQADIDAKRMIQEAQTASQVSLQMSLLFGIAAVIGAVVFGAIGSSIGAKKGCRGLGIVLAIFCGPIGLLILVLLPGDDPQSKADRRSNELRRLTNSFSKPAHHAASTGVDDEHESFVVYKEKPKHAFEIERYSVIEKIAPEAAARRKAKPQESPMASPPPAAVAWPDEIQERIPGRAKSTEEFNSVFNTPIPMPSWAQVWQTFMGIASAVLCLFTAPFVWFDAKLAALVGAENRVIYRGWQLVLYVVLPLAVLVCVRISGH